MSALWLVFLSSGVTVMSVQEMQTVCIVVSVCFLSFENFPGLREDLLEPSSRRDCGGCQSYDGKADGALNSPSQLILLLRFFVCMGRREGMGQVPYAWNALPPLLHLANSYSSFKTQLKQQPPPRSLL